MNTPLLLLILLLSLTTTSHAAPPITTCPTVDDIQSDRLTYWLPLYIEGEELVSQKDKALFKQHITGFKTAKWSPVFLESGHCFYEGTDPIIDKITYARDTWRPVENAHWQWLTPQKLAECDSNNPTACSFYY